MWKLEDYDFELPEDLIAYYPSSKRDESRLLIYSPPNQLVESQFNQLPNFLPRDTLLIFNVSKVIPARIFLQTPTKATIEILCLSPANQLPVDEALKQPSPASWYCLIKNKRRWRKSPLLVSFPQGQLQIHLLQREANSSFLLQFEWEPPYLPFEKVLYAIGKVPLPPYIKRSPNESDLERYQTVYAKVAGSIAAPTAGLHFTPSLLKTLENYGIQKTEVILHVGYGTFAPIRVQDIRTHELHHETVRVSLDMLKTLYHTLCSQNATVVPVGTTSLRTLESLYWLGLVAWQQKQLPTQLPQEIPYQQAPILKSSEAIETLIAYMEKYNQNTYLFDTQLYIRPGFPFQFATGLITNFHLPKSSLLVLVTAFVGEAWKKIYQTAIEKKFRFFSYGDASLLWRTKPA